MQSEDEIHIEKASIEDAEAILELQKLAYVSEAQIINDFSIPPLHQTMEEIIAEFSDLIFLKAEKESRVIGSVRCHMNEGTCFIGKLIVHPDCQNQGLGRKLLRAAELQFDTAARYELFTGQKSEKNLYIYRKDGYEIFRTEQVSDKLTLVFLEKVNSPDSSHGGPIKYCARD